MKLTSLDAKIRLYDGDETPKYLELILDSADFSGPLAGPSREQNLVLNRGKVDEYGFYVAGNDLSVMEPVSVSFGVTLVDHPKAWALLNMLQGDAVNGHEIVSTKGKHPRLNGIGLQFDGDDIKTLNVEYCAQGKSSAFCMAYNEAWFNMAEQTFSESEEAIQLSLTCNVYGSIKRQFGFTPGVDIMA